MKIPDRIESAKQALKLSQGIKSIWSHEALLLNQRTLIYIASLLEKMQPGVTSKQRKKREREWHPFLKKCLKQKMSVQDAIDVWNQLPCR